MKINVAVLGSGKIGTDLAIKCMRSPWLNCRFFVGRNPNSDGISRIAKAGVEVSTEGIDFLLERSKEIDLLFDATSAIAHLKNWKKLKATDMKVVDLTPAKVGVLVVPTVNLDDAIQAQNVNMISCGGQTSIPMAWVIGQIHGQVDYIEVVSSIASKSAGPATRINLDEYIDTTESALKHFSGAKSVKAILNLNPAEPCVEMQTSISAIVKKPRLEELRAAVHQMEAKIRAYAPGYEVIVSPIWEFNRIVMMVRVVGAGDYLPTYAGNLDIINCAAVAVAEAHAKQIRGAQ